jgi:hypothetical protein
VKETGDILAKARQDKDADTVDEIMGAVVSGEKQKNREGKIRLRRGGRAASAADDDDYDDEDSDSADDGPDVDVDGVQETGFEMKKYMGIFWPRQLWESTKKGKLGKQELTKIPYGGKTLIGVIKGEEHGKVPGCIELNKLFKHTANKTMHMGSSKRALRANEVEDIWNNAQARLDVATKTSESDAGDSVMRFAAPAAKKRKTTKDDGEEDEDDLWGDFFDMGAGARSSGSRQREEGEDDEPIVKKRAKVPKKTAANVTAGAAGSGSGGGSGAKPSQDAAGIISLAGGR